GNAGFAPRPMTRRAAQKLVDRYVARLKLDPNVTVHSLRVTAPTTVREQGSDITDLMGFAGHSDPRTTLTHIRNRLTVCPIRGDRVCRIGYENSLLPQRPDRCAMDAGGACDPGLSWRSPPTDLDARGLGRHLVHPAHRLPVAVSAQGLPAQEHRLGLL